MGRKQFCAEFLTFSYEESMEVLLGRSFLNTLSSIKWSYSSNPSTSVVNRASTNHAKTRSSQE